MKNNLFLWCGLLPLLVDMQALQAHSLSLPITRPGHQETKLVPDDTAGAVFFDDFNNGLRHWVGDVRSFAISDTRLCLSEQAQLPAAIAVPSARVYNTVWEAGIQVDGTLSTSNYVRLYLVATNESLRGPQQGYHLQIDGTDEGHTYRLWRQNGNTRAIIFESQNIPNTGNGFRARVRIVCTAEGRWQLFADEYDSGAFAAITGKDGTPHVLDTTYTLGGYAGYLVNCSPARRAGYKLDYLLIKVLDPTADSTPPDAAGPNDILINEILSHPTSGGVDFVELYNPSNKAVNLQQIEIASVNTSGVAGSRRAIGEQPIILYPWEYRVLTTNPEAVKRDYPDGDFNTFIEMRNLPDFNNETGGAVLYGGSMTIDSLFYTPAMQSPLIADHRGVSLERQHFSVPTNAPGNFRSAATSTGGATPGYQNSVQEIEADADEIFLTAKTFSPDNDGFEDRLEINYRFGADGFMANMDIYNDNGLLTRRLLRNQSLATQGSVTWDGLSDNHQRLPPGIYIAVIELYKTSGIVKIYRKSFVLAARQ
ncbi:hypothetical protein [Parapedobacter sp. DT-150]|uniref:lamin tail domain-containing protein n=1 Tax=Parapedobacter sp. DT-150 TaxID=3396162 RepID=UPI003F19CB25